MIIIKVLISKDFLVILAFQNGMCNTGVNSVERSMTKPNEIKPESAWDQSKKIYTRWYLKNYEIYLEMSANHCGELWGQKAKERYTID